MSLTRPSITSSHGYGENVTARWLNLVRFSLVNWLSYYFKWKEYTLSLTLGQNFRNYKAIPYSECIRRIFTRLALASLRIFFSLKLLHFAPRTFRRWGEKIPHRFEKVESACLVGTVLNANCSRMAGLFRSPVARSAEQTESSIDVQSVTTFYGKALKDTRLTCLHKLCRWRGRYFIRDKRLANSPSLSLSLPLLHHLHLLSFSSLQRVLAEKILDSFFTSRSFLPQALSTGAAVIDRSLDDPPPRRTTSTRRFSLPSHPWFVWLRGKSIFSYSCIDIRCTSSSSIAAVRETRLK